MRTPVRARSGWSTTSPPEARAANRSDDDLVAAALGGDPGAADALLRRHHSMIHAICRRLTGNEADALDATQEALLAIVKGLPRYDGRAKFSTWAYRVATNACLDELRRRKRRPVPVEDDAADRPEPTAALDDQVSQQLEVDDALARLPEEYRAAVVLRDLVGMDYADIASTLGIPPGTVRSRIARGRRALARLLGNPDHPTERPTPQP